MPSSPRPSWSAAAPDSLGPDAGPRRFGPGSPVPNAPERSRTVPSMGRLTALTKAYGQGVSRVEALRAVDLHLHPGEFVSVMGPSGSGKSTLLPLVGALDVPTSGTITIDGRDIGQLDDDALTLFRRRTVGLVFQFFNLLPTLDVHENVLLPVMLERRVTAGDRQRAERLLDQLGLGERMGHRVY